MTEISRGRQYEDGPLEPLGWNVYGSTAPGAEPVYWPNIDGGDVGHFLRNLLSDEALPGPSFTHTYSATPDDPSRPSLARRLLRRPQPTEAPFTHTFTRSDGKRRGLLARLRRWRRA